MNDIIAKLEIDWPDAVSDGLSLPCKDCGQEPRFDYRVEDDFWHRHVAGDEARGVICLPCLDARCNGIDLAVALIEIQWTGTRPLHRNPQGTGVKP